MKCRICGGEFLKTDPNVRWVMPSKNWYYHTDCYNKFKKQQITAFNGDVNIEASDETWFEGIYYILTNVLKTQVNFIKLKRQWESYLSDKLQPMTAKGIFFAISYFYLIKKNSIDKANGGIGIVPYIYDESCEYWHNREIRNSNICAQIEAQIIKLRSQPTKIVHQKKETRQIKTIDLSIIEEMEDEE